MDTFFRTRRIAQLVSEIPKRISVEDIKRILCDHANYPRSICRHYDSDGTGFYTMSSIIAEPAALQKACFTFLSAYRVRTVPHIRDGKLIDSFDFDF